MSELKKTKQYLNQEKYRHKRGGYTTTESVNPSDALSYVGPLLALAGIGQRALSTQPDFTISVNPVQGSAIQGGVITLLIIIENVHKRIPKYCHQVRLSSNTEPLEILPSFAPDNGIPDFDSLLSIKIDKRARLGDHEIIIKGNGANGKEHACTYGLIIKPNGLRIMSQAMPSPKSIQRQLELGNEPDTKSPPGLII